MRTNSLREKYNFIEISLNFPTEKEIKIGDLKEVTSQADIGIYLIEKAIFFSNTLLYRHNT